jgi:hypothetical protein
VAVAYVEVERFPFYCRIPSKEEGEWHLLHAIDAETAAVEFVKRLHRADAFGSVTEFKIYVEVRTDAGVSTWKVFGCLEWNFLGVPKEET